MHYRILTYEYTNNFSSLKPFFDLLTLNILSFTLFNCIFVKF